MRKHKTITISLPSEMVDYLDEKITQINRETFEETNRSKYIRLLIKKDISCSEKIANKGKEAYHIDGDSKEIGYYNSLLELGGYKR
ncbi:MAG: hypothetical protein FH758_05110 [Firmicutes bacterium]|nr:hypothetical protein [Bacillota bacterium]